MSMSGVANSMTKYFYTFITLQAYLETVSINKIFKVSVAKNLGNGKGREPPIF